MDYKSYKISRQVCSTWNELLKSDTYRRKEKRVFQEDIFKLQDDLVRASNLGRTGDVLKLLRNDTIDINTYSSKGLTPLLEAARMGHTNVDQILIEKGANIGKLNLKLAAAALTCYKDVVQRLLNEGAYPDGSIKKGWSAAGNGHKDVVRALCEAGLDRNDHFLEVMGRWLNSSSECRSTVTKPPIMY